MKIAKILQEISEKLNTLNAKAIIVGGSVRDHFLQIPIKDYDIEVYGLSSIDDLEILLNVYGKVNLVGKSFGVLKFVHKGKEYDFAFPRQEIKTGVGHKGFEVVSDGFISYEEASKRRDFTINAMGYDIEKKAFLDPFGGMSDMKEKVLRHIDDKTFVEDPLRVYRGVQFCARLEYEMAKETKKLCLAMVEQGDLEELPKERVFEELKKLLLKSEKPSVGFELFKELGVLRYFPELSSNWAKLDRLASHNDIILMLAVLTSNLESQHVESFMIRLSEEVKLIESVKALVEAYQRVLEVELNDIELRRLSTKVDMRVLSIICEDKNLLEDAKRLGVDRHAPKELLQGRDLILLGYKPSRQFSKILKTIYELQIRGEIVNKEEALNYVKENSWQ